MNSSEYFAIKLAIEKEKDRLNASLEKARVSLIFSQKALGWGYINTEYDSEMGKFGLAPKLISPELVGILGLDAETMNKGLNVGPHPVDRAWTNWVNSKDYRKRDKAWLMANIIELGSQF